MVPVFLKRSAHPTTVKNVKRLANVGSLRRLHQPHRQPAWLGGLVLAMSGLRGWVWTIVAVAGTATAATLVYRYATRDVRGGSDEEEQAQADRARDGEYESLSEEEELEEEAEEVEQQQRQQQLALVSREGNMVCLRLLCGGVWWLRTVSNDCTCRCGCIAASLSLWTRLPAARRDGVDCGYLEQ